MARGACAVVGDVARQGHVHVHGGGPEAVVVGGGVALCAGQHTQHHTLQAQLGAVLHLGDCIIDVGPGDDTHADEPVRGHCAVLFAQPVVVPADDRLVHLVMADVPPQDRPRNHRCEEHLGIDAVDVLLLDALLRRADARRPVDRYAEGLPLGLRPASPKVQEVGLLQGLAFHQDCIPTVGKLDCVGRPVPVLLGDAVHPSLRGHLQVSVAGNKPVVSRHRCLPAKGPQVLSCPYLIRPVPPLQPPADLERQAAP